MPHERVAGDEPRVSRRQRSGKTMPCTAAPHFPRGLKVRGQARKALSVFDPLAGKVKAGVRLVFCQENVYIFQTEMPWQNTLNLLMQIFFPEFVDADVVTYSRPAISLTSARATQ